MDTHVATECLRLSGRRTKKEATERRRRQKRLVGALAGKNNVAQQVSARKAHSKQTADARTTVSMEFTLK